MASPRSHPRRSQRSVNSRSLPLSPLRKSETFSARTGLKSELCSPHENAPFYPKRSPTSLDEVFMRQEDMIAARQEMVAQYLKDVDESMQDADPDSGTAILNNNNVLAVPELMVNTVIVPDSMAIDDEKLPPAHHHGSDSGLGSSVDTPLQDSRTFSTRSSVGSGMTSRSAITKSFSAPSATAQDGPELSSDALRHIREHILQPILANKNLGEYRPLVESIPNQVNGKIIANLRDLEKTFLYEAPRFSLSPDSFINFWEFSIQCLHSTVDYLTERDQRRPSDRPYTNNYFLDLVEQIRRYAEIMRRTREREENGEELDEMDYDRDEQIGLVGGLSNNGRPAELVRRKNGKVIPLIPEESRPFDDAMSSKRALSDDEYDSDDDVYRSMARRRKSDKAGDVMHVCSSCRKEFKRPCDLTKHEKTHSRPFKCTEASCRYHELGWPTEKERDRHVNDKHSSAPKMYHCKFPPCSYSSKRESNCKQHMEKAHGWTYVRSKSNGRNKGSVTGPGSVNLTPTTPLSPHEATPMSGGFTPESNFAPSPWWPAENTVNFADSSNLELYTGYGVSNAFRRDSTTTAGTNFTFSSGYSPNQFVANFDTAPSSENLNFNSPLFPPGNMAMDFDMPQPFQQPTPAMSAEDLTFDMAAYTTSGAEQTIHQTAQISPMNTHDVTLYSPEDLALPDDVLGDGLQLGGPDFLLFPGTPTAPTTNPSDWFPELNMPSSNGDMDMGFNSGLF